MNEIRSYDRVAGARMRIAGNATLRDPNARSVFRLAGIRSTGISSFDSNEIQLT